MAICIYIYIWYVLRNTILLLKLTSDSLLCVYFPLNKIGNNKIPLQFNDNVQIKLPLTRATRAHMCLNQPRFLNSTQKDGKLAANYNYNHYNLPFSHIMIIVIISDEDVLTIFV